MLSRRACIATIAGTCVNRQRRRPSPRPGLRLPRVCRTASATPLRCAAGGGPAARPGWPPPRPTARAATYPDVARTRAATRLVGETCSWLNPIPGRPLPAAVSVWGPRPGNDDRAALKRHPSSRQRKLRECAPVLGCCPHEVPLPGSQCGVGKGRTIAWTAHDDEFSSRDRSLAVAEQPAEGRRARCQAQW